MKEYFSEITKAVRVHGRRLNTTLETSTIRMVVTFPDRSVKIGMNLVKSLGNTGKWDEQLLLSPAGAVVSRASRIDNKRILSIYSRYIQEAVETGVAQTKI
jgi:hypothetical protein